MKEITETELAPTQTHSLEIASPPDLPMPSFVPIRYRPGNLGTWSGHLAFANDLIADIRPSLLVELGTHWGESYFTFCQSVFQNRIDCVCYSVDHWLGESHAGQYGEEVFEDVQQFNETHYRGFSYLLRTSFDDAKEQFADESIDLLHIDGLHTYEAVSRDFHTWLPKVKPGGILLMHDIAVRHANFGVWRLWDELKVDFPRSFEFHHWWGLGVLQKPGGEREPSAFLDWLFHSSSITSEKIRRYYLMQTAYLENMRLSEGRRANPAGRQNAAASDMRHTEFQIYLAGPSGYSEDNSVAQLLEVNQWKDLSFSLSSGTGRGRLRLDPSDCISVIEISRLALSDEATGELLFCATTADDFKEADFPQSALAFCGDAACCVLSLSQDPYLVLPADWRSDRPSRMEISIRVQTTASALAHAFQLARAEGAADQDRRMQEALALAGVTALDEISRLQQELLQSKRSVADCGEQIERLEELLAETKSQMRQQVQREVRMFQELLDNADHRLKQEALKTERLNGIEEELRGAKEALVRERTLLDNERSLRESMLQSKSWTLTKPLRDLTRALRS